MDSLDQSADVLWADLVAASQDAPYFAGVVGLVAVVTRAARSAAAACQLGPAHAVVQLAAVVVAEPADARPGPGGTRRRNRAGAYLAEPALSEQWSGYPLDYGEAAFAAHARRTLAPDVRGTNAGDCVPWAWWHRCRWLTEFGSTVLAAVPPFFSCSV